MWIEKERAPDREREREYETINAFNVRIFVSFIIIIIISFFIFTCICTASGIDSMKEQNIKENECGWGESHTHISQCERITALLQVESFL